MSAGDRPPVVDLTFPHAWQAEILPARPLILPKRNFVYPVDAEEVERGALEVLVRPAADAQPFLATCALGFRDPAVPSGIWSAPNADEVCAVSGGYAYLIDTTAPERFTMIAYRPVLEVHVAFTEGLLLFVGHRSIVAWGAAGRAWETPRLSDEGVTISSVDARLLRGAGWSMSTDKETPFTIDLRTGTHVTQPG
jgi:hypothetical protein